MAAVERNDQFSPRECEINEIARKQKETKDYRFPYYVLGPVSLSEHQGTKMMEYPEYKNMHLYLFGDYHEKITLKCPEPEDTMLIWDFFKLMAAQNPDKIIDIFVESPYVTKEFPVSTFYEALKTPEKVSFEDSYLFYFYKAWSP